MKTASLVLGTLLGLQSVSSLARADVPPACLPSDVACGDPSLPCGPNGKGKCGPAQCMDGTTAVHLLCIGGTEGPPAAPACQPSDVACGDPSLPCGPNGMGTCGPEKCMDGTTALHLLCTGGGTNGDTDGGGSRSTGIADSGGMGRTAAGGDAGIAGTGALGSTGWAAGASGMAGAAGATGVEGAKASGAAGSAATPKASADDGQGGGCSVRADRSSERGNVLALGLVAVGILFRRRRRASRRA